MIEQIAYISLGALITSVGAIVYYLKVLKPSINNEDKQQELDAKDKEIVEAYHQKALLEKELESVKSNYDTVKDSLESEKDRSKEQLSTLKQVDQFKIAVTGDVGEYKKFLKDQQEFIDKLTGNSKFQGNFGEKFLEQLLQMHGFKDGINYTKQKKEEVYDLDSDSSASTNPDIMINLTDNSYLICDSKVSLDNWKKFVTEKNDPQERDRQLKKHADSVKSHIDKLSKKDYIKNLKKNVFPKVVMFMCHEAAYLSALECYPDLYEYAYMKNVLLVGPGNILAVISIIETIKAKEKQIEGVKEITETAKNLYDKFAVLKGHLKKTINTYNSHGTNLQQVINNAWAGKSSLEKRIEKLKQDHGLNATKTIEKTTPVDDRITEINDSEETNSVN
jgi:DNA recombination protein RmuC